MAIEKREVRRGALNYFQIGDIQSLDFGVVIESADVFGSPQRQYEEISVPGRDGSILFDEGYYSNVNISYTCKLLNQHKELDNFRAWLLSQIGYVKLEDTYHPEEYRMAVVAGDISPSLKGWRLSEASFKVGFTAKPQRFLKIGDRGIEYINNFVLYNPTYFATSPIIRVFGYGTIGIGNDIVTVAKHDLEYIDIDGTVMDCYCETENANKYVTLSGEDYPSLGKGATPFTLDTHIEKIIIWPKWYTI